MTRQQYLSGVTRAGESVEVTAVEASWACFGPPRICSASRLAASAAIPLARDCPDSAPLVAGCGASALAAQLRRAGGCALDPERHQKYDLAKMQLHASLTEAATACLGDRHGLLREQPPPTQSSTPSLEPESLRAVAPPEGARAATAIDRKARSSKRFALDHHHSQCCHSPWHPPFTRGARDRRYGPRLVPSMFSSPTKPKREN